ncbi:MAG: hypothetical protein R2874_04030 [Desulfobacterales bacterium]
MEHTKNLCSAVVEQGADIGFAFDGDGDRLIAVDSNGQTVTGDQILRFVQSLWLITGDCKQHGGQHGNEQCDW